MIVCFQLTCVQSMTLFLMPFAFFSWLQDNETVLPEVVHLSKKNSVSLTDVTILSQDPNVSSLLGMYAFKRKTLSLAVLTSMRVFVCSGYCSAQP